MKESALIEVYKSIHIQFEQMFCLEHRMIWHSPPKMKNTFDKLGEYMQKESTLIIPKHKHGNHSATTQIKMGIDKIIHCTSHLNILALPLY